jgi:hypothetical protein
MSIYRSDGKKIFVRTLINIEAQSVKRGDVITVAFSGKNIYGTLLYPRFYRKRTDVKWEDMINN